MSRLTRRETSWVTAFRRFIVAATSAGTCYHARDYVTYGGAAFATGRINFFENINGASKIRSLQADLRQAKRITRRIISVTSFAFFFSTDFSCVFHDLCVATVPRAIVWHSFRWARGFYLSISILKKKRTTNDLPSSSQVLLYLSLAFFTAWRFLSQIYYVDPTSSLYGWITRFLMKLQSIETAMNFSRKVVSSLK